MQKNYYDYDEIRRAIEVLQDPSCVFEVRAIGTTKKDILSGYFRDADTLLRALSRIQPQGRNLYITLARIKDECFSRSQHNRFLKAPQTTSDTEIISYRWLFVDFDPVRPAGISSSVEELEYSKELMLKVHEYMTGLGFPEPITALSGNGYHLLYRVDVLNNKDGRLLIEKCLKVLSTMFNTDKVKIDTTNSNPSRICKLYGTLAQKGSDTEERPHRMSSIIRIPEWIETVDNEVLLTLANELPDQPKPQKRGGGYQKPNEFNLLEFLDEHGLTYEEDFNDRSRIFRLDHCPFDHSHTNGDARIFLYDNGAIAFKCHHNSCKQYRWQDVRMKYDPDAYDQEDGKRFDEGWQKHIAVKAENEKKRPKQIRRLKSAKKLMEKNLPEPKVFIGVGEELPLLVEGTCILSAKPKLGKSWFALSMCLAIANGEDFLGYKTNRCSTLYLDLETSEQLQQKRLRKALNGKPVPDNFYLDTEADQLENGFIEQIEAYLQEDPSIGVVVIDVFQVIRPPAKNSKEQEYERAYRDITPLNELAQKHNIAIILVCHDRKAVDPDDPFANILGSTGLQGAATQMIVMFQKKNTPIHVSVKGKTIDGLPELNVKLENAKWSVVDWDPSSGEKAEAMNEYKSSPIRKAVIEILKRDGSWRGRCSALINDATVDFSVPILDTPKEVGGFLHRHVGRFLAEDNIKIQFISNGNGPTIYKFTIDTIDGNENENDGEWHNVDKSRVSEIPFL